MHYHTVKEITDRIGAKNIESVRQQGKYVAIQIKGDLYARKCGWAKKEEIAGASVRPRILIRNY